MNHEATRNHTKRTHTRFVFFVSCGFVVNGFLSLNVVSFDLAESI